MTRIILPTKGYGKVEVPDHRVIRDIHRPYGRENLRNLDGVLDCGEIGEVLFPPDEFLQHNIWNLKNNTYGKELLIKDAYNDYDIPEELDPLIPTLIQIFAFEECINPRVDEYSAFLTIERIEQQNDQKPYLRSPKWHIDATSHFSEEDPNYHGFTFSSCDGAQFANCPLEPTKLGYLESTNYIGEVPSYITAQDNHLYCYDQINVHRSDPNPKNKSKKFLRLIYYFGKWY